MLSRGPWVGLGWFVAASVAAACTTTRNFQGDGGSGGEAGGGREVSADAAMGGSNGNGNGDGGGQGGADSSSGGGSSGSDEGGGPGSSGGNSVVSPGADAGPEPGGDAGASECSGGERRCDDRTPLRCVNGEWDRLSQCQYACVAGNCAGSCVPGRTTCTDGNAVECDDEGGWTKITVCEGGTPTCTGGQCVCEQLSCGDVCTDGDRDADNCGRCGRSCYGEACSGGACAPHVLATRTNKLAALAVNDTQLYFFEFNGSTGSTGTVYRTSTTGSTPQYINLSVDGVSYMVADGSYVYGSYEYGQSFGRMPIIGDAFSDITGGDGGLYISGLRLNSTHIFQSTTLSSNYFHRIPKAGGNREPLADSLSLDLSDFEVDDAFLYVRTSSDISRVSLDTIESSAVTSALAGERIQDMALSGDGDVIVFGSDMRVAVAPTAGGSAAALADESAFVVLADAADAYYFHKVDDDDACANGTEIRRVPLAGGDPVLLAIEPSPCPTSIVQNDEGLYYFAGDTTIKAVSK